MVSKALLCLAMLAALVLLNAWAGQIDRQNPTISLRYTEALTPAQQAAARQWEQGEANTAALALTFWGQGTAAVTAAGGNRQAQNAVLLWYDGTAQAALPAVYLQGGAPGAAGGCAVSAGLANALFGSTDVVGQWVAWGGETRPITGVFQAKDAVLLTPAAGATPNVEIANAPADTPTAAVQQITTLLGNPAGVRYGPQIAWATGALCWLPVALAGLWLAVALLRATAVLSPLPRCAAWLALALLAALALPAALAALPGWLVPARWSDFTFWQALTQTAAQTQAAWRTAPPAWRDLGRF